VSLREVECQYDLRLTSLNFGELGSWGRGKSQLVLPRLQEMQRSFCKDRPSKGKTARALRALNSWNFPILSPNSANLIGLRRLQALA
jgi:hypothetical protein